MGSPHIRNAWKQSSCLNSPACHLGQVERFLSFRRVNTPNASSSSVMARDCTALMHIMTSSSETVSSEQLSIRMKMFGNCPNVVDGKLWNMILVHVSFWANSTSCSVKRRLSAWTTSSRVKTFSLSILTK